MIKLQSVLIHPRPVLNNRLRRDRTLATGFGLIFTPVVLWLLLILLVRVIAS